MLRITMETTSRSVISGQRQERRVEKGDEEQPGAAERQRERPGPRRRSFTHRMRLEYTALSLRSVADDRRVRRQRALLAARSLDRVPLAVRAGRADRGVRRRCTTHGSASRSATTTRAAISSSRGGSSTASRRAGSRSARSGCRCRTCSTCCRCRSTLFYRTGRVRRRDLDRWLARRRRRDRVDRAGGDRFDRGGVRRRGGLRAEPERALPAVDADDRAVLLVALLMRVGPWRCQRAGASSEHVRPRLTAGRAGRRWSLAFALRA